MQCHGREIKVIFLPHLSLSLFWGHHCALWWNLDLLFFKSTFQSSWHTLVSTYHHYDMHFITKAKGCVHFARFSFLHFECANSNSNPTSVKVLQANLTWNLKVTFSWGEGHQVLSFASRTKSRKSSCLPTPTVFGLLSWSIIGIFLRTKASTGQHWLCWC